MIQWPTQPMRPEDLSETLRANRTYYVSDERLRAFAQLSYAQRLQWVEQCSLFVRMAQLAKTKTSGMQAKT